MTCPVDAESIVYVDDDSGNVHPQQLAVKLHYEVVRTEWETGANY